MEFTESDSSSLYQGTSRRYAEPCPETCWAGSGSPRTGLSRRLRAIAQTAGACWTKSHAPKHVRLIAWACLVAIFFVWLTRCVPDPMCLQLLPRRMHDLSLAEIHTHLMDGLNMDGSVLFCNSGRRFVCQLVAAASRQKLAHQRAGISLLTPASFQLEGTRPVPPESCGRSPELPAESLGLRVPRSWTPTPRPGTLPRRLGPCVCLAVVRRSACLFAFLSVFMSVSLSPTAVFYKCLADSKDSSNQLFVYGFQLCLGCSLVLLHGDPRMMNTCSDGGTLEGPPSSSS